MGLGWSKCKNKLANVIPLTVFWILWKEKNSRAFEGEKNSFSRLKDRWLNYFGSILLGHDIISNGFWKCH